MNRIRKLVFNPFTGTLAALVVCHSALFLTSPSTAVGTFLYLFFSAFVMCGALILVLTYGRYGDWLMELERRGEPTPRSEVSPLAFAIGISFLWLAGSVTVAASGLPANEVCLAVTGGMGLTALSGMIVVPATA
ncbi:hypothetical protein AMJ57_04335 [Parcubacteria bacterium SG8_24]|nr:MAG: hypothetical protein AMJ57_04335 [Parcubacteria bacterium SG8_24]